MRRRHRLLAAITPLALAVGGLVGSTPAEAAAGSPVVIVAHTSFGGVDPFESSLPGCESGTVENGAFEVHFTARGGVFNGDKVFTCNGGASGFVVRLRARFGLDGSTGTWTIDSGWGDLAGLKGSGSLVGILTETGIDDVYTGSVR